MNIVSIAGMGIVAADPAENRALFIDALGLPLEKFKGSGDYYSSEKIEGAKHFSIWPLTEAAEACFGKKEWPSDRPVPQLSIEFEVASPADVGEGAKELEAKGYELFHGARMEPWGQTVARLQSPDGAIVGISYAPWQHEK